MPHTCSIFKDFFVVIAVVIWTPTLTKVKVPTAYSGAWKDKGRLQLYLFFYPTYSEVVLCKAVHSVLPILASAPTSLSSYIFFHLGRLVTIYVPFPSTSSLFCTYASLQQQPLRYYLMCVNLSPFCCSVCSCWHWYGCARVMLEQGWFHQHAGNEGQSGSVNPERINWVEDRCA